MAKQRGTISKKAWDRADPGERAAMILGVLTGKRMDQDKLTKLLEVADQQSQAKLRVLHNTVVNCLLELKQKKPGAKARIDDLKAAERALEDFAETLWKQHFQEDEEKPEEQPDTLPNLLAVVDYLGKQGWSIKKSAVYKHQKEGKIRPGKDGKFRIQDVDTYAEKYLQRLDGSDPVLDSLQEKKLKADTQKAEAQARHWRLKTKIAEGLYIQRDEYERDLAARAAVFKLDIENFIRSQASEIIHIVEGDESKTGDLIEFMLDRAEGWLDRYTVKKSFKVVLPRDTDEDETD